METDMGVLEMALRRLKIFFEIKYIPVDSDYNRLAIVLFDSESNIYTWFLFTKDGKYLQRGNNVEES